MKNLVSIIIQSTIDHLLNEHQGPGSKPIPLSLKSIKELWAEYLEAAAFQHREQTKQLIRRARRVEEALLKQQAVIHQERNKIDANAWYCTMTSIASAPQSTSKSKMGWTNTRQFTQRVFSTRPERQITRVVPITRIEPPNIAVPLYNTYVGIDRSILTESNDRLLSHPLPLLEGDQVEEQLTEELPKIYSFSQTQFDRRAPRLLHDHQRMHWAPYVKKFLKALGITEEDVLYMFFAYQMPESDSSEFERILKEADETNWPLPKRPMFEQPQPSSLRKWVFHRLKKPTIKAIAYAALACAAIDHHRDVRSGFNSWECFRRSPVLVEMLLNPIPDPVRNARGVQDGHLGDSSDSNSDVHRGSAPAQDRPAKKPNRMLCRICHL
jgi:hypothetical protein